MLLTLDQSGDARQANFIDERGQLLYKTDTPWKFGHRTTTIVKAPSNVPGMSGGSVPVEIVAEIEWGMIHHRFRFAGQELEAGNFIPSRGKRVFNGPDGREYEWKMCDNLTSCELRTTQDKHTIARSHRAHFHFFSDNERPKLEIFPEGCHMLDAIVMTFVFVDHLRREKKQSQQSSAANSGAAAGASAGAC
ncbi:hypothetical protein CONPUDRAFT_160118 [Coniophora puteana RWD-64-598 SS2]|uniref:DUF6593 domain-containing protein n=1 Tax=Coniophora puteana (strain RWD-64-598) TaxID=741705 RepID=R7SEV4_CONPW|nr:uncharacterized protein CONPUDRAFT_160118 [Coniophora puteana RWD-64-598 SS2]EIW74410.1 hypothetical protein CONPUDRAFT_160118 [Coniophora puteana RWD-64-598 SS2]